MGVQIIWVTVFTSFRYIPRSGIAGSDGNSMFNFLRNCHIVFHSGCTILHSHQQYKRVPISPHPHQYLLFYFILFYFILFYFIFLVAVLMGVRWYLIVALICISLMISNVENLFICVLAIYISSLEKCLFKSFAHFWIRFCCCWAVGVIYTFWILTHYQLYDLQTFSSIP